MDCFHGVLNFPRVHTAIFLKVTLRHSHVTILYSSSEHDALIVSCRKSKSALFDTLIDEHECHDRKNDAKNDRKTILTNAFGAGASNRVGF